MSKERLKPCPFCDYGKPRIIQTDLGFYQVVCSGCCSSRNQAARNKELAIEWWNHRPIESELLDALKENCEEVSGFDVPRCYACRVVNGHCAAKELCKVYKAIKKAEGGES